jgi:flagella basal body P-ring formation protein FlgA
VDKTLHRVLAPVARVALPWLLVAPAAAATADDVASAVERLAKDAAAGVSAALPDARVEVEVGELDPRLRLAPCADIRPYLPPNARLWGRARVGLRCESGPVRWNVYLPLTVRVHARALVVAGTLPAGHVVGEADLQAADVDIAAGRGSAVMRAEEAVGRALARPLPAGAPLRSTDLKPRLWFAAGDSVRVIAVGTGYAVSGEGQALAPGVDGQPVRVRTESGRIVTGVAVAERRVEVAL